MGAASAGGVPGGDLRRSLAGPGGPSGSPRGRREPIPRLNSGAKCLALGAMRTLDKPKNKPSPKRPASSRSFQPKTQFGKRLWTLRQKSIAEAGKLLDWDELEKEVALRKGRSE